MLLGVARNSISVDSLCLAEGENIMCIMKAPEYLHSLYFPGLQVIV